jgi:hypothetical protein
MEAMTSLTVEDMAEAIRQIEASSAYLPGLPAQVSIPVKALREAIAALVRWEVETSDERHPLATFQMLDRLQKIVPKVAGGYSHITGGIDTDYMVSLLGSELIAAHAEIADPKVRLTHRDSDFHKRRS